MTATGELGQVVALVMAGGVGSRMAKTHPAVPKPLVRVGGVPLVEIVVRQLLRAGLRDVRLALRHGADEIIAHLNRTADLPALRFLVEDEPLGTIGALALLQDARRTMLVVNGDLLSAIDLAAMLAHHRSERGDLTIATHLEHHRLKLGEVVVDEQGRVLDYLEKPVKSYRISSGTYLLEPKVLRLVSQARWLTLPSLVQSAVTEGLRVLEFAHGDPWLDVNDARDLAAAEEMLAKDPVAFGLEPRPLP